MGQSFSHHWNLTGRPGQINAWDNEDLSVRHAAWARMAAAGVHPMNWFSVACELHRDWRNDIEGPGSLLATYIPAVGI